jgi:hypothetical protein
MSKPNKPNMPTMPTNRIALKDVQRAVVLQTAIIQDKIMAWLVDDDRFLVEVDPSEGYEGAAKAWFVRWFDVNQKQTINIITTKNEQGILFVVQIKTK